MLVAFVTPALGYSVNSKELTEFLQTKHANYRILAWSNKFDRNALKALPTPDAVHHGLALNHSRLISITELHK